MYSELIHALTSATIPEWIAVISGIASVWCSRQENVWVYPLGLVNTVIYTWLSFVSHLPGEAAVNFYYTIMSLYGWYCWLQRDEKNNKKWQIQFSNARYGVAQLIFFLFCYAVLYFSLVYLKENFFEGAIPWADALASAAAFTGMWLMTHKKVESWYWWLLTNVTAIPLYFTKGLVLTSGYYLILTVLAITGLIEWKKRAATA
ncbi:MAG: nicotinamide riboside transporter PnuC [Sphingomonadales bacterium]